MNGEHQVAAHRRPTRTEVLQLVEEFVSSGMRRSEFCHSRGLSFSTLDRHLKKRRWKRRTRSTLPRSGINEGGLALRRKSRVTRLESMSLRNALSSPWVGRRPMGTQNSGGRTNAMSAQTNARMNELAQNCGNRASLAWLCITI